MGGGLATKADSSVMELAGERTPVRVLLRDVWRGRDLLVMLARQDYRSRYRSASLGLLWSVVMPLLQGLIIAVVFGSLIGGGAARIYVPYVVVGVMTFGYLNQSLSAASTSIVDSAGIAGRIYFPRLLLPAITPTANLPALLVSLVIAEAVVLVAGQGVHPTLLLVPLVVLLAWLFAVLAGALLTMLHVYSRDVRYIVQAVLMAMFYATPIIYFLEERDGIRALPDALVPWVLANPLTGIVQLTRLALVGEAAHIGVAVAVTCGWIGVLAVIVPVVYSRLERVACDRL
jgi:lipopolysaccharide transport system permease protein